jgi:hypothetical protein
MIIEDILIVESGLIVVDWIGDSIDENKLLSAVGSHFGEDASYELVDFTVSEEGNGGKAYVKQLRGDDMVKFRPTKSFRLLHVYRQPTSRSMRWSRKLKPS